MILKLKSNKIKLPKNDWHSLLYWDTGEWQVIEERLNETEYCPSGSVLFHALQSVDLGSCRCAIVGQDPYPELRHCTGRAFETPRELKELPASLVNIFKEYEDDMRYPAPKNGDLTQWVNQGVLLWNAYPSCAQGKPGSHHWEEWTWLTKEILEKLNAKKDPVVFIFLGRVAANFSKYVDKSRTITTSHPSPLGVTHGFRGSKIFSRTNALLSDLGQKPIVWLL